MKTKCQICEKEFASEQEAYAHEYDAHIALPHDSEPDPAPCDKPQSVPLQPVVQFSILPCPFCGMQSFLHSCMGEHWVNCENKECQFDTDFYSTPEMAVEIWNDSARCHANKSNPTADRRATEKEIKHE